MLIDSHCHLYMLDLNEYQQDLAQLILKTHEAGITTMLSVAVDIPTSETTIAIAEKFDSVFASVGVHPSDVLKNEIDWKYLEDLARHPKVIAIGETGLDYYYNKSGQDVQREAFRQQIKLALAVDKPLIIHSREAAVDTIQILREENASQVRGVMHCFTESWDMAMEAMALGFFISFSGIITFKNAEAVQEVAKQVPLEYLLIETDAPYLAPVPYRGKSNKPEYVRYIAEKIAQLKELTFEEIAAKSSANFNTLFLKKNED